MGELQTSEADYNTDWRLLVLGGISAGMLSGFFGIGGGLLFIPLMVLVFKYPIKKATGTSLTVVFVIVSAGVLTETIRNPNTIVWSFALLIAIGALVGVRIGKALHTWIPDRPLRAAFALFILFAAVRIFMSAWNAVEGNQSLEESVYIDSVIEWFGATPGSAAAQWIIRGSAMLVGLLTGIVATILGIGGGVFFIIGMSLLYPIFLSPEHPPRATSLAIILFTSSYAAFLHMRAGNFIKSAAKILVVPGVVGVIIGVLVGHQLSAKALNIAFSVFLVFVSIQMAWSATKKVVHESRKELRPPIID